MSTTPTGPFAVQSVPPTVNWLVLARGIAGAIAGGIAGYFVFYWLYKSGLYGIMIPGMLLGLAAGWAARGKSLPLGIVCCLLAIGLTLFTEWHVRYSENHTFVDFLSKLQTLGPLRLLMMGLGAAAAYWFGQGR